MSEENKKPEWYKITIQQVTVSGDRTYPSGTTIYEQIIHPVNVPSIIKAANGWIKEQSEK